MTDHTRTFQTTFLYGPRSGPLAGKTVRLEASNDFAASMIIDYLTGQLPRAGELAEAPPKVGEQYPTLNEALEALNR